MMLLVLLFIGCLESPSRPSHGTDKVAAFQAAKAAPKPHGSLTVTVTGKAGPLAGVAVWLGDTGEKVPPKSAALALTSNTIKPSLLVLPPGSGISIHNTEARARTVRLVDASAAADAPALVERALPPGATAGLPLPASGMLRLICGPDPCPGAALVVGQGGLTDALGQVALAEVPAGPVRVHVWSPTGGEAAATTEILANANASLSIPIP